MSETRNSREFDRLARDLQKRVTAQVVRDQPSDQLVTLRCGGPARLYTSPTRPDEVIGAYQWSMRRGVPTLVLGAGSNLLIRDEGFDGLVLDVRRSLQEFHLDGESLYVGAGVMLPKAATRTARSGLAGLSWAVGIPGTIGGAIWMNAGTKRGAVADHVNSVRVVYCDGPPEDRPVAPSQFGHRISPFQQMPVLIIGARFVLSGGSREELEVEIRSIVADRRTKQPLNLPNCGSVFKATAQGPAWKLIDAVGLRGARLGGAQISEMHSNFIVNWGGATAADVLGLIDLAVHRVVEQFGVTLEPELVVR